MPDDDTPPPDDDDTPPADDDDDTPPADDDDLDLEGARAALVEARAQAADYRTRMRRFQAELEQLKREGLSEQERAVAEAEQRGRDAAEAEHGRKLLEAQLLAAAAGKLRDPADAVRYIDLDALLELEDGDRALEKKIGKLLEDKPYLAVDNGEPRRTGVQSQGKRTAAGEARDEDGSAWLRRATQR